MKRIGFIALGVALFVLAFGIGLAVHFPTIAITRAIEGSLNAATVLSFGLTPVRMTLGGLRSDRLTVRDSGSPNSAPFVTLTDVRVPYSWSLVQGASLRANFGKDGRVAGFMAWNGMEVAIDEFSARLEDLGGALGVPGMTVKGRVTLSGTLHPTPTRSGPVAFPEGEIRGKAESIEIAGIEVAGTKLPVTRLQDVDLNLRTGRTVRIERIEVRGDLQGSVQGTVIPTLERPRDSRINLTVAASLRQGWVQETGALRPILEGFFPGGRIEGALNGSIGVPNWVPGRGPR